MGSKKNRNPEKKERKSIEKQQQHLTFPVQPNINNLIKLSKEAFNNGWVLYNLGKHEEAIKCFDKAIELNPTNSNAYICKGSALNDIGKYEDAIECYDKAIELDATNSNAYICKGTALTYLSKYEKAIECYDKAIELDANNSTAYNAKGSVLDNIGKYEDAIKCFDEVIKLDATNSNANEGKGSVLFSLGRYKEAIEYFDKAIKKDPNNNNTYSSKGIALIYLSKYKEAIECFDEAIELDATNSNANNGKAVTLINLGENEETKKLYKEWTKETSKHYIKWLDVCLKNAIIDYTTSMRIYQLRHLLLKQKDKVSIIEIDELTKNYIKKIVEVEHSKNENEIKEYYKNNDENEKVPIRDEQGNIVLYQYSPYNKNAIYKIKQREMYFSDPLTFNDPFDPLIRVLSKEHSKGLMELLNFRVSCLSPQIDNLLLWSHYADKHQGICVAYDITELVKQNNIIFRKIEHKDTFPKPVDGLMLALPNIDSKLKKSATLIDTFTQKQRVWNYEDEYRLILQTDKEEEFLQQVPIKEIYLGRNMPADDKEFIKDMINEMNSQKAEDAIIVYSMDISDDDIFKLMPTSMQSSLK